MTIVNSWNDWDPLREVIVGSARGAADMGCEPALSPYFQSGDAGRAFSGRQVPSELVDEAERQLDHFIGQTALLLFADDTAPLSSLCRLRFWDVFYQWKQRPIDQWQIGVSVTAS